MKKIVSLLLIIVISFTFSACNYETAELESKVEELESKVEETQEPDFIDEDGNKWFKAQELEPKGELIDIPNADFGEIMTSYHDKLPSNIKVEMQGCFNDIAESINLLIEEKEIIVEMGERFYNPNPKIATEIYDIIILDLGIQFEEEVKTEEVTKELEKCLIKIYSPLYENIEDETKQNYIPKLNFNDRYIWAYVGGKLQGDKDFLNEKLFMN